MLLQLEQECLNVYKRKVEQAAKSRAQLLQALADAKLEFSTLLASLGEKLFVGIVSNIPHSLFKAKIMKYTIVFENKNLGYYLSTFPFVV